MNVVINPSMTSLPGMLGFQNWLDIKPMQQAVKEKYGLLTRHSGHRKHASEVDTTPAAPNPQPRRIGFSRAEDRASVGAEVGLALPDSGLFLCSMLVLMFVISFLSMVVSVEVHQVTGEHCDECHKYHPTGSHAYGWKQKN